MTKQPRLKTLFTDIGGVLLNNGWDRKRRALTVAKFKLDPEETNEHHHLTFDTYEEGKISLDEYLDRVVFYKKRNFSRTELKRHVRPFRALSGYGQLGKILEKEIRFSRGGGQQ
jgi:putative hydrolase of the HAD superfamily